MAKLCRNIISMLLYFLILPLLGVTLDLQPVSKMIAESVGVVEVCVSLYGELETSVNAMVFTVPGDAKCE